MENNLIILIPKFEKIPKGEQQKHFSNCITHASEREIFHEEKEEKNSGDYIKLNSSNQKIDIIEAYWADLIPSLDQAPLFSKVIRGITLPVFWLRSGILSGIRYQPQLIVNLSISMIVLAAWYGSVLLMLAQAMSKENNEAQYDNSPCVEGFVETLSNLISEIAHWEVWAVLTLVIGLLPVSRMVDTMDFAKRYISNEASEVDQPSLRLQILHRVRKQVIDAISTESYDEITIVAHSFGAIIAIDILADMPLPKDKRIRLITLGSPFEVLAVCSDWLKEDYERLIRRKIISEWKDLVQHGDWMATGCENIPKHLGERKFINPSGTLLDRVTAKIHSRYFDHNDVIMSIFYKLYKDEKT